MTAAALALIVAGLLALALGGELIVRGAVTVAELLRVSPLLIGLTLVGFGGSTPELLTSVFAALDGAPGIAVGNVVGSNTSNVLLIIGLASLARPLRISRAALSRDGVVLLGVTLVAAAVISSGGIGRAAGAAFIGALLVYVVGTYLLERHDGRPSAQLREAEAGAARRARGGLARALAVTAGGLGLTLLGAYWLVGGALDLSRELGISDVIVGLTIVAVGTSLPELVTSVIAARRGHSDVALGNIVGSNLYNLLGILGLTAVVAPIDVPEHVVSYDIWVMLAASAVLFIATATGRRISRAEGAVMVGLYALYMAFLAATATGH